MTTVAEFMLNYEGVSPDDIQDEVDLILAEMRDPQSEAYTAAESVGIEPENLADAVATVRSTQSGFDPSTILVGIAISTGSTMAQTFWKEVIWPRLRRKLHLTSYESQPPTPTEE